MITQGFIKDYLTLEKRIFTDLNNLILLKTYSSFNSGGVRNSTFRKCNETSGYQVPTGKTFKVLYTRYYPFTLNSADNISLCYADADVGVGVATALTNPILVCGEATIAVIGWQNATTKEFQQLEKNWDFDVPANKFVCATHGTDTSGSGIIDLWGYEY